MPESKSKPAKKQSRKSATSKNSQSTHRWVASVKTVSTFPPEGLFTKSASAIAKSLASKKVSPKGPASGMRMLNYYINRAGHNLPTSRKAEFNKAKEILSEIIARHGKKNDTQAA